MLKKFLSHGDLQSLANFTNQEARHHVDNLKVYCARERFLLKGEKVDTRGEDWEHSTPHLENQPESGSSGAETLDGYPKEGEIRGERLVGHDNLRVRPRSERHLKRMLILYQFTGRLLKSDLGAWMVRYVSRRSKRGGGIGHSLCQSPYSSNPS